MRIARVVLVMVVAVIFVTSMAFAQKAVNVEGIKLSNSGQTYDVPFISSAEKADGTGPVDIVVYQKVTKEQLENLILRATQQVNSVNKQIADAKKQLDKIKELEKNSEVIEETLEPTEE